MCLLLLLLVLLKRQLAFSFSVYRCVCSTPLGTKLRLPQRQRRRWQAGRLQTRPDSRLTVNDDDQRENESERETAACLYQLPLFSHFQADLADLVSLRRRPSGLTSSSKPVNEQCVPVAREKPEKTEAKERERECSRLSGHRRTVAAAASKLQWR